MLLRIFWDSSTRDSSTNNIFLEVLVTFFYDICNDIQCYNQIPLKNLWRYIANILYIKIPAMYNSSIMPYYHWTSIQNKISLLGFFHFKLFICPPDVKKSIFFRGFTPGTPTRAPSWTCWGAYKCCYKIQCKHVFFYGSFQHALFMLGDVLLLFQ